MVATSRVIRFKKILAKQAEISHTFCNKSFISVAGSCVKHGRTKKADVKFHLNGKSENYCLMLVPAKIDDGNLSLKS